MKQVCEKYCIDLIRAQMQGKSIPELPKSIALQALFEFAKKHSVEALVFHGLEQLDVDENDPVWQNWCNRAQMLLAQSIVQLADRDTIIEELTSEGIELLPIKGSWLKEQYPEIDYRQMSDLDILIRKEDRKRIDGKMRELGYHTDEITTRSNHVGYIKPPYTEVEMHLTLLPRSDPRHTYYDHVWKKVVAVEGRPYLYRLRAEDEYIYYILHLQKHVSDAGTGIRSFLDSVVYRSNYPVMDREYLQKEFEKLGVREFVQQVETLADCWFATGKDVPKDLLSFAKNILADGVYGSEERMIQNRLQVFRDKYKNPRLRKMVYFSSRIFLPRVEMEPLYPILERIPVLLPIFWIIRLASYCIQRPKTLLRYIRLARKDEEKND